MESERYLNRIGLSGPIVPDRLHLDELVFAHKCAVPFENLDIFDYDLPISLEPDDLFEKIVVRRRGGYCFELNELFTELLRALGYSCYCVAARVPREGVAHPLLSHRGIVVELDGRRLFCDVGFGGISPPHAVDLESGGEGFSFTREGRQTVMRYLGAPCLLFSEEPFDEADFISLNEYQSRNPRSYFRSRRLVNLTTPTGSIALTDLTLSKRENGVLTQRELTEAELPAVLREEFGIVV